jgi:hypothetical protein
VVAEAEVGGQGDDGVWFSSRGHLRTILVHSDGGKTGKFPCF